MLIAIDHGNKNIKTAHKLFTSGLTVSDTRPPFGDYILQYEGKYYVLSEQRIPYMRNKAADNRFFILTLFAIAFELEFSNMYSEEDVMDIQLAIGLPPLHFGAQYEEFQQYFIKRDIVDFMLNDRQYSVLINRACCYPQAYAAAMTSKDIRDQSKVMVVDIGGFTVDYLQLKKGRPEFDVCDSMENGIIVLYNDTIRKVNADLDMLVDESDIDMILMGNELDYPEEVITIVRNKALAFVDNLAGKLRERMIDLRVGRTVFVGGGAKVLKSYIEASDKIGNSSFMLDLGANVHGYTLLYKLSYNATR